MYRQINRSVPNFCQTLTLQNLNMLPKRIGLLWMNRMFFVFPILMPSFKLLFVYLMSKNEDRIRNNSHEEEVPHHSHRDLHFQNGKMYLSIYPGLAASYIFEFKHMK
jgi:hypothetical protein